MPRTAHLAIIGESNSGKGSVLANLISQEVTAGGEIWFIDLKAGMEAENYAQVLDRKAYDLDEAEALLADFNAGVDTRAEQWRGKMRSLDDAQAVHRLLVIDEAADMIRSGANKKKSDACVELVRSALSRSRALNCTVAVATQNPRVSTSLPYRSLLLTTLALRLNSKSEAVMAMGDDAVRQGARPWLIPFNRPGDGYLWDTETNQVKYLHVPFITDEEIHALRRVGGDGDGRSDSDSPVPATPPTSDNRGLLRRPLLRCEMRDEDA
ncbi:ATP-binding protein [Bifidobacterium catenulatum]|uniref:ATP-binding protein n=1 Tax=Bifidobacterium catenulatum TaxID=1686 RepID=UPI00326737B1